MPGLADRTFVQKVSDALDILGVSGGGGGAVFSIQATVSGGAFTFDSIPATARDLEIYFSARVDAAVIASQGRMRFNNDATAVYSTTQGRLSAADAFGASGADGFAITGIFIGTAVGASGTANSLGHGAIRIPNYANTDAHKGATCQTFTSSNSTTSNILIRFSGGEWRNTAAITRVDLVFDNPNLTAISRATLRGLN